MGKGEIIKGAVKDGGELASELMRMLEGGAIGYGLMTQPNQTEDQRTQGILNYMGGL